MPWDREMNNDTTTSSVMRGLRVILLFTALSVTVPLTWVSAQQINQQCNIIPASNDPAFTIDMTDGGELVLKQNGIHPITLGNTKELLRQENDVFQFTINADKKLVTVYIYNNNVLQQQIQQKGRLTDKNAALISTTEIYY